MKAFPQLRTNRMVLLAASLAFLCPGLSACGGNGGDATTGASAADSPASVTKQESTAVKPAPSRSTDASRDEQERGSASPGRQGEAQDGGTSTQGKSGNDRKDQRPRQAEQTTPQVAPEQEEGKRAENRATDSNPEASQGPAPVSGSDRNQAKTGASSPDETRSNDLNTP